MKKNIQKGECGMKKYLMGTWVEGWREAKAQNLTFIVTEDCNLRCKYCYVTHKSSNARMTFETVKKFIDYIFKIKRNEQHAVILDFIGGEPFLEIDLIDQICDYFKIKAFELNDEWYWNYRINVCTNGVNYNAEKIQNFIKKNHMKLSVTISIDGIKEKHDMQRVFPDGRGSYDAVMKNVPLWLNEFVGSTKVTFSSDDLKYLKDSIIHLWNIGINEVAANVVFEDVWKENDDIIFEQQLKQLADYVIENELYDKYQCTLFVDSIGFPETEDSLNQTSCGAGIMLALGVDGKIYPCQRYYPDSLNKREGYVLGDIEHGLDKNRLRVFGTVAKKYQCSEKCQKCEVASGCMYCQAFSYDDADTDTNFQRATYICKMHKARVRANNYYFAKLRNIKGIRAERGEFEKNMYFILGDNYISYCSYLNEANKQKTMSENIIKKGLEYCHNNFYKPIFVHFKGERFVRQAEYDSYEILHIVPSDFCMNNEIYPNEDYIIVVSPKNILDLEKWNGKCKNVIFNICEEEMENLSQYITKCYEYTDRINLNIQNITSKFNYFLYKKELKRIADFIIEENINNGKEKEINVLTDILWLEEHEGCKAGEKNLTYAPDGKLYICPAYYSQGMEEIGDVGSVNILNQQLYSVKYFPICQNCDTYQCERCVYINKLYTGEVNVSPEFQCKKAHIERMISLYIQSEIEKSGEVLHHLDKIEYLDPYSCLKHNSELIGMSVGDDLNE